MANNEIKKHIARLGGTTAFALAMTAALSTSAYAEEVEPDVLVPETSLQEESGTNIVNPVEEVAKKTNEEIGEDNAAVLEDNKDVIDENEQAEAENKEIADANSKLDSDDSTEGEGTEGDGPDGDGTEGDGTEGEGTEGEGTEGDGAELPEFDAELGDAPVFGGNDDMNVNDYNDAVDEYNKDVDDYNQSVGDYNDALDEYNKDVDDYNDAADKEYQEAVDEYNKAEAEHKEAERQYGEYAEYQKALTDYETALDNFKAAYDTNNLDETDYAAYQEKLAAYETALNEYVDALGKYETAVGDLDDEVYAEYLAELETYKANLESYKETLDDYHDAKTEYEKDDAAYDSFNTSLDTYKTALNDFQTALNNSTLHKDGSFDDEAHAQYVKDLDAYIAALQTYETALDAYIAEVGGDYSEYKAALDEGQAALETYKANLAGYNEAYEKYVAEKAAYDTYSEAVTDFETAKSAFESAYADALSTYEASTSEANYNACKELLDNYKKDLETYGAALGKYEEATGELGTAKADYDKALADLNKHIADLGDYNSDKTAHDDASAKYETFDTEREELLAAESAFNSALDAYKGNSTATTLAECQNALQKYADALNEYEAALDAYTEENEQKEHKEDLDSFKADLVEFSSKLTTYQNELDAYKNSVTENQAALEVYNNALTAYDKEYSDFQAALNNYKSDCSAENYQACQDALSAYGTALQNYMNALKAVDPDTYNANEAALQNSQKAVSDFADALAVYDQQYLENKIYSEVFNYNSIITTNNETIKALNDALKLDTDGTVANIGEVGANNAKVDFSGLEQINGKNVLDILNGYTELDTMLKDLQDAKTALDNHEGMDDELGSAGYAAYLDAVKEYNDDVDEYNIAVEEYQRAVEAYNKAVEAYNLEQEAGSNSSSTNNGTSSSTNKTDWGNVTINNKTFGHIDVKYRAAASKDVTMENGKPVYSDTVNQYTVVGVYYNKAEAEKSYNTDSSTRNDVYGVSYWENGTGNAGYHSMGKNSEEFVHKSDNLDIDPVTGKISFYVTLTDSEGKEQSLLVNLDSSSVYADGSYYKVGGSGKLDSYRDSNNNPLEKVTIDGEEYYNISGKSVFLISSLTCNGMRGSSTLTPHGLDLVLNLQTMIEIHQANVAQKLSYKSYEFGVSATAEDPADPTPLGDLGHEKFEVNENNTTAPTLDDISDFNPITLSAPVFNGEVPDYDADFAPVDAVAPTLLKQEKPDTVDPITGLTAPSFTLTLENPNIFDGFNGVPEHKDPGPFTKEEPKAPVYANKLDKYAQELVKLESKIVIEPAGPGELIFFEGDLEEILEEPVPLAHAPNTGSTTSLMGGASAVSALGLVLVQLLGRKKRKED